MSTPQDPVDIMTHSHTLKWSRIAQYDGYQKRRENHQLDVLLQERTQGMQQTNNYGGAAESVIGKAKCSFGVNELFARVGVEGGNGIQ